VIDWDLDLVEGKVSAEKVKCYFKVLPIVFGIEAKFGTDVSHSNAWKGLVSFDISDGHDEVLDSVLFAIYDKLCLAYNVCARESL
jgi:hypothetical protein